MELRALILNIDGTLVDTDELHFGAYARVFAGLGRSLVRPEYDSQIAGQSSLEILCEHFPDATDDYRCGLVSLKEDTFRNMSPAGLVSDFTDPALWQYPCAAQVPDVAGR